MGKKKLKNLRVMRFMADADVGHDVEGAPEVRLRVYATIFKMAHPNMRFMVGRIMNFNGEERLVDEGPWTQTAAYLEDIDPLKLYEAMVRFQNDLASYLKEWLRRKEAREPLLSIFDMRAQQAQPAVEPPAPAETA